MEITTETLSFPGVRKPLAGFLARPQGEGPFPGLIVIHEIYGLEENVKNCARRFAEAGYVSLAVDLFAGSNKTVCMFRTMSGLLFHSLDHQGIHNLKAALNYLETLPDVNPTRVGAVGYCMGGSLAIAWACTDNRLKAIAPYYAVNPKPQQALERLCPVVGSYPEKDFTARQGQRLDLTLDQYGVAHDIKIYSDAQHSFVNPDRSHYNRDAAEDSWERVLAFFQEHIH
jgi:carboxymethylenebutenolidase